VRIYCLLFALCFSFPLQGAYLYKDGRLINKKNVATLSLEEHYQKGIDALKKKNWDEACSQFRIVVVSFEEASLAQDARYFLGVALYEKNELDLAHDEFSLYLKATNAPTHLEDVHRYLLAIAEKLKEGSKRHMFGRESFPKWMSGQDLAIEIFDEVSSALPHHELAAKALLLKASLLREMEEFSRAIDTYQVVIRRFSKTSFSLSAFVGIAESYVEAIKLEPQNIDAIALAEINVRESKQHFPQAKEISLIESNLKEMQEVYANALFETGQLYERMSQPKASALYYHTSVNKYPSSRVAPRCKERLVALAPDTKELNLGG
jgi:outer membrane protein assembly factor BamD (BamD/ComL family)